MNKKDILAVLQVFAEGVDLSSPMHDQVTQDRCSIIDIMPKIRKMSFVAISNTAAKIIQAYIIEQNVNKMF